jgi:O-antigen ligase
MAAVSWANWDGFVKGVEFSVLDALALALYINLPPQRRLPPFSVLMLFYFLAVLFSIFQAGAPVPALFYPWQLARMFLVYVVVSRASEDPRVVAAVLQGMGAGLCLEAGFAIWQRLVLGELQTTGLVGHQNILGMMSHFVVFPFFALLLATRSDWYTKVVLLAGMLVEVLTTSRATVGLGVSSYVSLFILSALRGWSSRKARIMIIGLAAAAVVTPLAITEFQNRLAFEQKFETTPASEAYDERAAFNKAAEMIFTDHPWGVGANQYVYAAYEGDYYRKAGVGYSSWGIDVHNVYWLVAAETGYIGLITFVPLLLYPVFVAFRCGWRNRRDQRGDLLLGLGVALLAVYIHSFFEFAFVLFEVQYLFVIALGMTAGLARQLGYWGPRLRPAYRPSPDRRAASSACAFAPLTERRRT